MNNYFKKLLFFITIPIINNLYFILFNHEKVLKELSYFSFLIPGILICYVLIFTVLFYFSENDTSFKYKYYYMLFPLIVDQISKYLVYKEIIKEATIVKNVLYIRNHLTGHTSYMLDVLGLNWHNVLIIIMKIFILLLFLYGYRLSKVKLKNKKETTFWANVAFIFLIGGILSSIADSLFWIKTLDFIFINKFFFLDLKDIFVVIGINSFAVNLVYLQKYDADLNFLYVIKKIKSLIKIDLRWIVKKIGS